MTAQVAMILIFVYSGRFAKEEGLISSEGQTPLLTAETMAEHNMRPFSDYRWSHDNGHGASMSSTLHSRDASPTDPSRSHRKETLSKAKDDFNDSDEEMDVDVRLNELPPSPAQGSTLRIPFVDRYLSKHIPNVLAQRPLQMMELAYEIINRTSLILGFVAILSGGVTWSGLFVSDLQTRSLRLAA